MSFNEYESSKEHGEPIYLFEFAPVEGRTYRYTNADEPITLPGETDAYVPEPIAGSAISSTGSLDKAALEISLKRTSPIGEAFRVYPTGDVVRLTIKQVHRDDPNLEALVVWAGRVLSAQWEPDVMKLNCEPVNTSMRRNGLRRHYQLGCPFVLYGAQCAASKAAATTPEIEILAVNGTTIVLPNDWIPTDWDAPKRNPAKFVGGMATWEYVLKGKTIQVKRTILQVNGSVSVVLSGQPSGLAAGSKVKMVLGCDHLMSDCAEIHKNIRNFGGQPFIPTKNPFRFVNNFY